MACIVMDDIVMACIVMAYIVMDDIVMACIVMAYIVGACVVMASARVRGCDFSDRKFRSEWILSNDELIIMNNEGNYYEEQ